MSCKGAVGGPWGLNLKLTLDILELMLKSKKRILLAFNVSFEFYIRYFGLDDEKKKFKGSFWTYTGLDNESRKKVLSVFNGKFLSNLFEGGYKFFNICLGSHLKKSFQNPAF